MNFPAITDLIPQRPPFLFVDKIDSFDGKKITATLKLHGSEDFFKGHFPNNPIMPGVLLQEALFQTGAAFMSLQSSNSGLGVVTRVQNVKFKSLVKPGDELFLEVELVETIQNASYMKGSVKVSGKTVAVVEFAVAAI